ncbi:hypothetical protein [Lentzea sp. NBRC 102530]|uniref:hypothetical protein n=1 Tax=Lentzea sp. NBRC 102530 TaxID=3032201 RepID=UPI0024A21C97|nr:hypothetical protein [Lentzea sp. NBRC 102530]GLY55312.1 hypothetical protein Lesp01_89670 [Lentzea sp. NBRC 102530]
MSQPFETPRWVGWLALFLVLCSLLAGAAVGVVMFRPAAEVQVSAARTACPPGESARGCSLASATTARAVKLVDWYPEYEQSPGGRVDLQEDDPGWDCRLHGNRVCGEQLG